MRERESGTDPDVVAKRVYETVSRRSELPEAAIRYAARGTPVFPCRPGGKGPLTSRGHLDATTDPRRIHMWWNRWPEANIGIPTGERSGILALDVDQPAGLDALEAEIGRMPATRTHATGSGGMHYLFKHPAGSGIRNSAGKLAEGLDVRGEGGYIIVPPSRTARPYEVLDKLPLSEPPAELLKALKQPGEVDTGSTVRRVTTAPSAGTSGPPIPEGTRDGTLTSIAGRLHDGTRSLEDLSAELLEINKHRCEPPLPDSQVLKIARSVHGREPCRRSQGRPKEVDELAGALSEFWHGESWRGIAGKSEARFARALIREGRKVGTAIPAGLRVEKSFRQMAEILGVHRNTVTNVVKRAKAAGWLRQDNATRSGTNSGAFVLVDPRRVCDTNNHPEALGSSVTSLSRPSSPASPAELSTLHYRHRGPVGYSREHTLCILEAHGPQSRESAAELLGWMRPRDLERLHLEPLTALGLLEKSGDAYAVPGDARERGEAVRSEAYSTIQERVRRVRSVEGRYVHVVAQSGIEASALERDCLDRERHEREREAFRNQAQPTPHWTNNPDADGTIEDLVPAGGDLSPEDAEVLRAIEAFEEKYGRGSFRWDRASSKGLFYSGPISGHWPEPDQLLRIRYHVEDNRSARSAA